MKIVNRYSDDFKREVVRHYLTSDDSQQKTADKFNLPAPASVQQWLDKFGGEFRTDVVEKLPKTPKTELPGTTEDMIKRIKELEEALEREQLLNLATNKMIDIAEQNLNISIRKKSGAKQSKK
ncbi:transposase [Pedobacter polysacchareus]|uniref:transposase n=1 Tax=Pedobacter polysacchareus TaxID=2861973 RepID=UPI001C9903B9|nr:transposase [Pedobacter polysacchareus]